MKVLLVEDDETLASGLLKTLRAKDFVVNHVANGKNAIHSVKTETPDMLILDIGLPDISGLDVMKAVRAEYKTLPVLMLTARDSVEAKVLGLEAGADDYLTKPFDVDELVARLRVFERRLATSGVSCLSIADVELDINSHTVTMAGSPLVFSRREYMLLKALMESAGRVLSKEQLESKLYSWGEEVSSNTIEVHIHNLRKKLPKDFIKNIRGIGYTVKAA
jgi:two-component system OmpR family response regulator/two-component system response regulator QseB